MKKPDITKGEWTHTDQCVISNKGGLVADCQILGSTNRTYTENEINAKAISAVPDMIEALLGAIEMVEDTPLSNSGIEKYKQIEKALEKAGVEL